VIAIIAKIIVPKRECCPFLTFELVAQPNMEPVIVRVTGPAWARDLLKAVLYKPVAFI
jgi:hypothetical protein